MTGIKIGLLLKDTELLAKVRDKILTPAGFQVFEMDEEQARSSIRAGIDLDLVIVHSPRLEEDDLRQVSTFLNLNPIIPILLIFEAGPVSNQVAAFRLGVADCLPLPFQNEELLQAVGSSLKRWSWLRKASQPERIAGKSQAIESSPGATSTAQRGLEELLDSAMDGIVILDEHDRLSFINVSARQILNLEEQDLIGQSFLDIVEHADLAEMVGRISEARFQHEEISLLNEKVYNTQLSSNPGIGTVMIMQDISRLKELDRIKSDFVATVSHDLRSPLTAILGYTELIDRVGSINDQQREFIRRIQFSTNNITNLINDLLDLGRIEADFDTQKELVSLASITRYAVEGLRSRIEEKKQDIQLDLEDSLPSIFGNPIRLRQMAGNLIGNAVKYTPPQGRIWVRVLSGDGMIIFQVQDTGLGIPPQDQPHVFNKFYRGTNFPPETPGTGLGLAIVKSVAENHQGRVWVESSPGNGSTFTVVLPSAGQG